MAINEKLKVKLSIEYKAKVASLLLFSQGICTLADFPLREKRCFYILSDTPIVYPYPCWYRALLWESRRSSADPSVPGCSPTCPWLVDSVPEAGSDSTPSPLSRLSPLPRAHLKCPFLCCAGTDAALETPRRCVAADVACFPGNLHDHHHSNYWD